MFNLKTNFHTDGEPICGLIASPPNLTVATWGGLIQLRDLITPFKIVKEIANKNNPYICFTHYNNLLYVNKENRWIEIWNLSESKQIDQLQITLDNPASLVVSRDFLAITDNIQIEIIDLKSRKSLVLIDIPNRRYQQIIEKMFIDGDKIYWKFSNRGEIQTWSLTTFKEEFKFVSEPSISSFLIASKFLFIATEDCVETGEDDCTLNIWDLKSNNIVKRLDGYEDEFYFMISTNFHSSDQSKLLIATTIDSADIWEWGTWKHIDRVENIGVVHHILIANNQLFVGDINGVVSIWDKNT